MRAPLQLSLTQKFLVPLLAGWLVLQLIVIVWMLTDFDKGLRQRIESRGELLVNSIAVAAATTSELGEFRRIVSALGGEKEIKLIIVAAGDPLQVIASNKQQYVGKLVADLNDNELYYDMNAISASGIEHVHHHTDSPLSELGVPLILMQPEIAQQGLVHGVVMVYLDTSSVIAEQWQRGVQLVVVMLVVSSIGALLLWYLLRIYVLRSTDAMTQAIKRRSSGNRHVRSQVYGNDEMSWLTRTLNGMFDELEQEEKARSIAEANLQRANILQKALFDAAGVAIISTDTKGVIAMFNPYAEKLLGYRAEEMVGRQTPAVFHDAGEVVERSRILSDEFGSLVEPGFDTFVMKARKSMHPDTNEWMYIRKDGVRVPVRLTVTVICDDSENVTGYLGIAQDITEEKRTTQELYAATQAAHQAAEAKSEFLATMSHEIRTPMNGVIGMTHLLQKTPLTQKQKELVESIHFSGEVLMAIINDVLDFSKIDADKMMLEKVPFSVTKLFDQTYQIYSSAAEKKEIKLVLNKPDIDCVLIGDPIRLTQIVNNLVSNAIKFTEQGCVTISVVINSLDENNKILQFSVKDTGVGMAKTQQSKLFQPFTQADSSTTRQYGGTGLGLVICKKLILLMGGDIALHSKRNLGTEFVVKVPLSSVHGKIEEDLISTTAILNTDNNIQLLRENPVTILLVDDVLINQEVARGILEEAGCKVLVAGNGFKALEIYQNRHSEIDIVLMDCLMPEMDGYQTAQKIREFEQESHKHTPIIALTASALAETREKCLAAGMDDFVSKPFNEMELLGKIRAKITIDSLATDVINAESRCVSVREPETVPETALPDSSVDHEVLEQLFSRFGNEKGKILLDKFIASMDEFVVNLDKAFSDGDNITMHRMVHNLKSSCGNVGAIQAKALAAELEQSIDDCDGVFSNRASVNVLIDLVAKAKQEIINHRSFS